MSQDSHDNDYIIDDSDLRKYRIELPNLADDVLGPYQMRLYVHYLRVCGAGGGTCWQSVRTTAAACKMSIGKVVQVRKELAQLSWIRVVRNERGTYDITILDRWSENFARYAKRSQGEHSVHQVNTERSPGERKKEPIRKNKKERGPTPEAVRVFREATYRYPPRSWYQRVDDVVGDTPESLEKWRGICHQWIGKGFNSTNVADMLDVFENGWRDQQEKIGATEVSELPQPLSPEQIAAEQEKKG